MSISVMSVNWYGWAQGLTPSIVESVLEVHQPRDLPSTMQNRTQLLRGILPKIRPFSRPSLPMAREHVIQSSSLWKTSHCHTQSVTNAVPTRPPWHHGIEAMTSFLENSGTLTNKGQPVPSITIHTPHDRQASYGLHLTLCTSTFMQSYIIP